MRVLVTRPEPDAERTAERLAARGHQALIAPLTRIVATGAPPPAGPFDALILTSAHAVAALRPSILGGRPVFAVGHRTAAAARAAGLGPVHIAEGDAQALAALVAHRLPPGAALVHAAGRHRKAEPESSLRQAGFAVHVWEVYEACAADALPDGISLCLKSGEIGAALHFSRRHAGLLVELAAAAGLSGELGILKHLCLSHDVAAPLAARGLSVVVSPEPKEEALLSSLDAIGRP
jgi:uroporphyrinogen-III synthase